VRVKYLGRAPLDGDDTYERRYLASQSWVHLAAKKKSGTVDLAALQSIAKETLPAENPDNLNRAWRAAAASSEAPPADRAPQGGQRPTKVAMAASPQTTGAIPLATQPKAPMTGTVIQAGSFKNKDNAERARSVLSAIAPVDVTPIDVGADVYYRVRIGPFASASEAKAALNKVARSGYRGAKVVTAN
jgi:rare lipoprotein A